MSANNHNTFEINNRIAATWVKWKSFVSFLCCVQVPFRVRKMCYIAIVYNTLNSALEAFVLTKHETDRLTKFMVARLRSMYLGRTHHISIFGKHKKMTNVQVLRWAKILPPPIPS